MISFLLSLAFVFHQVFAYYPLNDYDHGLMASSVPIGASAPPPFRYCVPRYVEKKYILHKPVVKQVPIIKEVVKKVYVPIRVYRPPPPHHRAYADEGGNDPNYGFPSRHRSREQAKPSMSAFPLPSTSAPLSSNGNQTSHHYYLQQTHHHHHVHSPSSGTIPELAQDDSPLNLASSNSKYVSEEEAKRILASNWVKLNGRIDEPFSRNSDLLEPSLSDDWPESDGRSSSMFKSSRFQDTLTKFILENTDLMASRGSKHQLAKCMLQCAIDIVNIDREHDDDRGSSSETLKHRRKLSRGHSGNLLTLDDRNLAMANSVLQDASSSLFNQSSPLILLALPSTPPSPIQRTSMPEFPYSSSTSRFQIPKLYLSNTNNFLSFPSNQPPTYRRGTPILLANPFESLQKSTSSFHSNFKTPKTKSKKQSKVK